MTAATVQCTCWCEADEVVVPVEWVSEGRTVPCDLPGCEPGCPSRGGDAFDEPFMEPETVELPVQIRKRMTTSDYDPAADSSPGTEHLREAYAGLILYTVDAECDCGCRSKRGGKKSRFLPGHDAKLKGKLQRALAAECPVYQVGDDGSVHMTTALDIARYYDELSGKDWTGIVRKGAERIIRRSQTPIAAEKRLARLVEERNEDASGAWALLHFGRWEQTGRAMAAWRTPTGRVEIQYATEDGAVVRFETSSENFELGEANAS